MTSAAQTFGTFTTDARLVVRTWDPWLARVTAITAVRARLRPLAELVPDLEQRGLRARFERVLAEGVVEVLAPAFHGYLFPCPPQTPSRHFQQMQQRVTIAPLREGRRIVGALVTVEDVTARRDHERDLAAELESPDEMTRLRAAQALAAEVDTAPTLASALSDTSWRVRQVAVAALVEYAGDELIGSIVQALRAEHRDMAMLNSTLQLLGLTHAAATRSLVRLLSSEDADLRIYVALALGDRGDRSATPDLLALLDDPDVNVRYHAIEALGKLGAGQAAPRLAEIAQGGDEFLAFAALDALARIGDALPPAMLLPLLDNPFLAEPTVDLLGRIGDLSVVAPLAQTLEAAHISAPAVARALAALYDREALVYGEGAPVADEIRRAVSPLGARKLLDALKPAREVEAVAIGRVLAWLGDPELARALIGQIGRPGLSESVVEAVVRAAVGVDELIALLGGDDEAVITAAASALGRLGARRAVPALTALLQRRGEVAIVAAGALAQIGDPAPFEALLSLLDSPEAAIRRSAVGALHAIGHPQLPERVATLIDDPSPHVREAAVQIAGYFGYTSCASALLARCQDPDERVRRAAVAQLPFLDDPAALPTLTRVLRDGTPGVRAAAARAFAHVEPREAVAPLLGALCDPDPWVRYYAAHAFGCLGPSLSPLQTVQASGPLLICITEDPAPHVRLAAVEAIGRIGGDGIDVDRSVRYIATLVASSDLDLARAAIGALGGIAARGGIAGEAAGPHLAAALGAREPARRLAALEALARRGDSRDLPLLVGAATGDRAPVVRAAAVAALGTMPGEAASSALVELAADSALRPAVVAALAAGGAAGAAAAARGLAHQDAAVRHAMVQALARTRQCGASNALRLALADADPVVRAAAAAALDRLTGA